MPKKVFTLSFTKFEWVCVALLEFKSWPGFDEGIFQSYAHLNIVVPALGNTEDDFQIYKGPGLNKIPGRIQTLNPYSRDDISSATFSKDTLGFQSDLT